MPIEKYLSVLIKDYKRIVDKAGIKSPLKEKLVEDFGLRLSLGIKNSLKKYREVYLKTYFGEGIMASFISKGLEKLIEKFMDKPTDKLIEYAGILMEINKNGQEIRAKISTRMYNVLKGRGIRAYSDLQRECYRYFEERDGGARSWKNEETYKRYFNTLRNFGPKCRETFMSYLKKNDFDFSREAAENAYKLR